MALFQAILKIACKCLVPYVYCICWLKRSSLYPPSLSSPSFVVTVN